MQFPALFNCKPEKAQPCLWTCLIGDYQIKNIRIDRNTGVLEKNERRRETSRHCQNGIGDRCSIHLKRKHRECPIRTECVSHPLRRTLRPVHADSCSLHHWNAIAEIVADVKDWGSCHDRTWAEGKAYHIWMLQRRFGQHSFASWIEQKAHALSRATAASARPIPATWRIVGRSLRTIPANAIVPAGYMEQITAATSSLPVCEAIM